MRGLRWVWLLVVLGGICGAQGGPSGGAVVHLVNGKWFDGKRFVLTDFYIEGAVLTKHPQERRSVKTVDLQGGFVVPPYGDAHEHNFDGAYGIEALTADYLRDGIFYAQGMTDTTEGAQEAVAKHLVNTPTTVDVTYAHGGLTGVNGHPKEVYEGIANGFYRGLTPEQTSIVVASHKREGLAYWEIATPAELEAKWPRILAAKPDLIKIYIGGSGDYKAATAADPRLWKGLDPVLVPMIVKRAHAAGLKVAAHVDTPADVHLALVSGVDELGHLPGYAIRANDALADYRLSDADVALAGKLHVKVQATAGIYVGSPEELSAADLAQRESSQRDNLRRLRAAGVTVLIGSDHYGQDSRHEADYLQALGVWSNLEMLRMWAVDTPQDVFPRRKVGELREGFEASFLVLAGDPLVEWGAVHGIRGRWKDGVELGGRR